MATSDRNQVLRWLPLTAGVIGGSFLVINRIFTPELLPSQARSDALAVLLSALLIFTTLIWQQIQPRRPDAVTLSGSEGFELATDLPEVLQAE
ncbi:MAG: cofactor assembly of complex C subunit B, partial [Cyanobacteria bacterium P01_H01_bin.121]